MKRQLLIGKLIYAGNLTVNGEEITGCAIEIDRDKLESIQSLPMYFECIILPISEFQSIQSKATP